ncbi:MAG: hypothetical protein H3C54_00200 [Taibaiella sp.]|nr:hypothetical protein [Taibaiella sp.]
MKQEQTTKNTNGVVMIVVGDISNMGYGERQDCCRQLATALGVNSAEEQETVRTAFPDSLFLSDKELTKMVNRCSDVAVLRALYQENRHRAEQKPLLQQMFAARLQQLEKMNSCIDY